MLLLLVDEGIATEHNLDVDPDAQYVNIERIVDSYQGPYSRTDVYQRKDVVIEDMPVFEWCQSGTTGHLLKRLEL